MVHTGQYSRQSCPPRSASTLLHHLVDCCKALPAKHAEDGGNLDPRQLFPLLAAVFLLLALVVGLRRGSWRGGPQTWLLLALIFGAVSLWLRYT